MRLLALAVDGTGVFDEREVTRQEAANRPDVTQAVGQYVRWQPTART